MENIHRRAEDFSILPTKDEITDSTSFKEYSIYLLSLVFHLFLHEDLLKNNTNEAKLGNEICG